ncbi:MAG: DeoR/GlpR family DNA-binding transcription regulator [Candidatus Humimicrobiaceae bacterium]
MITQARRNKILEYMRRKKTVTIDELVEEFDISDVTIRRDLTRLAKENHIKKVYGGATFLDFLVREPVFLQRIHENINEKTRIAVEAGKRISDGDIVLIESGSTCLELAKHLEMKKDLKIIATCPHILNMLCDLKRVGKINGDILCCGGIWRQGPDIFIGPQAISFFNDLKINIAFFGLVALNLKDGWMGSNSFEAELTKKIISVSEKIIGITVSSKFERVSLANIGPVTLFDEIITDNNLDIDVYKKYKDANIKVTLC